MLERYVVKRALLQAQQFKPLVSTTQQQQSRLKSSSSTTSHTRNASSSFLQNAPHRSIGSGPLLSRLSTATQCLPSLPSKRSLSITASSRSTVAPFEFLTGYAFQGKPRHEEQQEEGESTSSQEPVQIGFPAESDVGKWRDTLLRGGEAGEDALMCTEMGAAGDKAIGVADGVGGWTENGVDPSLFSQALMYYASKRAQVSYANPERIDAEDLAQASSKADGGMTPKEILTQAYDQVLKEPLVQAGSATACIITLDSIRGTLRSANLGDSGFVVLRQGCNKQGVLYASPPQQFGFNTPLQLAKLPAEMVQEGSISNKPKDADVWECTLRHGDLIVVGTDGLFDNVDGKIELPQFAKFIKEKHHANYASRNIGEHDSLAEDQEFVNALATNLVEYAKLCQNSTTKQSPFEREAARYGIHYPGGKVDDVAVVCCLVVER